MSLSAPSKNVISVTYYTAAQTASGGADYGDISGTLWFMPGETQKTVSVSTYTDLAREDEEMFAFHVSGLPGLSAAAIATIVDDRWNVPAVSVGNVTVTEGSPGTFTVSLSAPSKNVISVTYQTAAQTASGGADYGDISGTLWFMPGETQKTVSVSTYADRKREAEETFLFRIIGPPDTSAVASATILDVPFSSPPLTVHDVTVSEGNAATLVVTLSAPAPRPFVVRYATRDGSSLAPGDYRPSVGTVSFAPGEVSKQVVIPTFTDLAAERPLDEHFFVDFLLAENGVVGASQTARVSISDRLLESYLQTDLQAERFYADGKRLVVEYTVADLSPGVLTIGVYSSQDGLTPDHLLATHSVSGASTTRTSPTGVFHLNGSPVGGPATSSPLRPISWTCPKTTRCSSCLIPLTISARPTSVTTCGPSKGASSRRGTACCTFTAKGTTIRWSWSGTTTSGFVRSKSSRRAPSVAFRIRPFRISTAMRS